MLTCFPMLQREGITMSVARRTWRRGLRSTMPGMCRIRQNSALGTSTPLLPFAPKRRPSPLRPISKPIRVEPSPRGTSDSQSLRPVGLSASSIRKDCCDGLSLSTRGPKGSHNHPVSTISLVRSSTSQTGVMTTFAYRGEGRREGAARLRVHLRQRGRLGRDPRLPREVDNTHGKWRRASRLLLP